MKILTASVTIFWVPAHTSIVANIWTVPGGKKGKYDVMEIPEYEERAALFNGSSFNSILFCVIRFDEKGKWYRESKRERMLYTSMCGWIQFMKIHSVL